MTVTIHTGDIYYTARIYFRQKILPNLPNDEEVWREEFHRWLASQGARIKPDDEHSLITDILGVSPGYDTLEFEDERLASLFVLKWS